MSLKSRFSSAIRTFAILLAFVPVVSNVSSAEWKEKVLYSFQGGSDGSLPAGGVVFDSAGNLYGATADGGLSCPSPGCGTVFQLVPPVKKGDPWTETVLHVFDGKDGTQPTGGLILDSKGNLYGVTGYGGSGNCELLGSNVGCGLIYELSPPGQKSGKWTYRILYSFLGGKDGQYPVQNLTLDLAGNLYGATIYGGGFGTCNAPYYLYCGTAFKLSAPTKQGGKWKEKLLYAFKSGADGANPNGGLVFDGKGAIYGTTFAGGNQNCKTDSSLGCGTAFRLRPPSKKSGTWAEKQLHIFTASDDGRLPSYGAILDATGALYGASEGGAEIGGVVFRLSAVGGGGWQESVVYGFSSESYSYTPAVALFDKNGDLYGTTNVGPGHSFFGSVFRLGPPGGKDDSWNFSMIYGFTGVPGPVFPNAGLVFDKTGNLYGMTTQGGTGGCPGGCGAVFEVSP